MDIKNQKQTVLVLFTIFFLVLPSFAQVAKMKIKVIVEKSILRLEPDINSTIIGLDIPKGRIYEVEKKVGEWFEVRVRTLNGVMETGYLYQRYVEVVVEKIEEKPASRKPEQNQDEKPVRVKEPSRRKGGLFGFYINGGVSFVDSGDFNSLVNGYRDYSSAANYYINWPKLGSMMEFGAEILLNFTQNIGFGIGAGYMTKTNVGEYGSQNPSFQVDYDREYGLKVIPISGNLHIRFLTTRLFGFSINGGVDYLMGTIKHTYAFQSNAGSSSRKEEVKCNTVGYHGGIGLDINFSSHVSLVLEGSYRFADFKNWKGSVNSPDSGNFDGELYYYEYESAYYDGYYPRMWVWNGAPSASYYRNVRLARINLSGFSSKIGIKINF